MECMSFSESVANTNNAAHLMADGNRVMKTGAQNKSSAGFMHVLRVEPVLVWIPDPHM
jgi:hypothetical protein